MTALTSLLIRGEADVFGARQRSRDIAGALGIDGTDQVRVAIAVSELGRVVVAAGARAQLHVAVERDPARLVMTLRMDHPLDFTGPVEAAAVSAARRLLDDVVVDDGTAVTMSKQLPGNRPVTTSTLDELRERITGPVAATPWEELRTQNAELLRTLEDLQAKQDELVRLNDELQETNQGVMAMYSQLSEELEETNRGVVALYAELDERGERLREANNAKSRFLASVSHELRTPLNSINGLTELLREPDSDPLTPVQDNQIRLIAASTDELLTAVNGLLDLARAESGRVQPEAEPVDVAAMLADLRATVRPLTAPGVQLVVDVPADLGLVVTDQVLLAQLVRNLVSNALKFTEHGQVVVTVRRTGGDLLSIEVRDSGIGIAPELHDLVFEEFYRVPSHLQVRSKSTGLGLPYARRVAEALGGALTMTSEPGRGSTFVAVIRAGPPTAEPDAATASAPPHLGTVLIGDDDPTSREILRDLISGASERVVLAEDAETVIAALDLARPDLLLLDLVMPAGGGERVLAELAGRPEPGRPAVVVVSAAGERLQRVRAANPSLAVLDKASLDRQALVTAVATALGKGTA